MSTFYQNAPTQGKAKQLHDSFYAYLCHRAKLERSAELETLLAPLNALPWEWWPQAAKFALKALRRGGVPALLRRLGDTLNACEAFTDIGLHMRASLSQYSRAFASTRTRHQAGYTQSQFIKEAAQAIECVARELLMHTIEGNQRLSRITSNSLEQYETNLARILKNTHLGNGYSAKTLQSIVDDGWKSDAAMVAEFHHRSRELSDFFFFDIDYVGRQIFITAPPCFHPGPYRDDADERWIEAGRPTPKQSADWILGVLDAVRARVAAEGNPLAGFRAFEAHGSGTAHLNLIAFFKDDDAAKSFEHHLQEVWRERDPSQPQRRTGAFNADRQAIVSRKINSKQRLDEAVGYAAKGVTPKRSGQQQETVFAVTDRQWCHLWSIKQFYEYGSGETLGEWRAFQRLDPRVMQNADGRAMYSVTVLAAYDACQIEDHSYRTWLRLTHALTADALRYPVTGPQEALARLTFERSSQDGRVYISVFDSLTLDTHMSIEVQARVWERLDENQVDFFSQESFKPSFSGRYLYLSISYPTTPSEPPPDPPPKPPRKRFCFKRP